jgi:glycosyltransferase involved in cell wall biosynthesis
MKIVFATPTLTRPFPAYLESLEKCVPALDAAGIEHKTVFRVGSAYISHARSYMLRQAMDTDADAVVFIDHDLEWSPEDMIKLIQTEGDVVCGTYRFKQDKEEYMASLITDDDGFPITREDGCMKAYTVPAGFLKITRNAVRKFMKAYPELVYGNAEKPSIDLFNHGAHKGLWWGEDYAFSRRWHEAGEETWLIPNLNLNHHSSDKAFNGNFHEFMKRQPKDVEYAKQRKTA